MDGIIAEFTDHTGIVEAKAGYEHISSYKVEDLQELLSKFKPGTEVRLAALPHQKGGNVLLMKPRETDIQHWVFCCPMLGKDKNRYPVPIVRAETCE